MNLQRTATAAKTFILTATLCALLAACGGGGGGTPGSGYIPTTAPAATATPPVAPQAALSGHVYQLAGPLSNAVLSPANAPTPAPNAMPTAGAGIATANVYVVAAPNVVATAFPSGATILAQTTTASDGSFSVVVPGYAAGQQVGIVVAMTPTIDPTTGLDGGYTQAHILGTIGTPVTAYLDTLSANEQIPFGIYNQLRSGVGGLNVPIGADTYAEMTSRLLTSAYASTGTCSSNVNQTTLNESLGGAASTSTGVDSLSGASPDWTTAVGLQSQPNVAYAGFHALIAAPCVINGVQKTGGNYFAEYLSLAP